MLLISLLPHVRNESGKWSPGGLYPTSNALPFTVGANNSSKLRREERPETAAVTISGHGGKPNADNSDIVRDVPFFLDPSIPSLGCQRFAGFLNLRSRKLRYQVHSFL
mmetsp:Transcript_18740/g.43791  ORF Transcript_18740/g.43791 Transcript_18740/m.43791 type:complete len:108 (+) Transcript_18740:50-373(+)